MKKIDTKALFNRKIEKLLRIIRIMVEEIVVWENNWKKGDVK